MSIKIFSIQPVSVPPVQSLNNGLTLTGTTGQLGGTFIKTTIIDTNSWQFAIYDSLTSSVQFNINPSATGASISLQAQSSVTSNTGQLQLGPDQVVLTNFYGGGGAKTMNITATGWQILDSKQSIGLTYQADYSAAGALLNRWIPDYGAVKNAVVANIAASNGLTKSVVGTVSTVKLGGALTADTTVTVQPAQTLLFQDSLAKSQFLLSPNQIIMMGFNSFIQISSTSMTVQDGNNSTGLLYNADYSAIGLTLNRWIPDLGGVKAYLATLQLPVVVSRYHVNGLTVGTTMLVTYAIPAGTSVMYRINTSDNFRSGAGQVGFSFSWTDTSGTVNTKTLGTIVAIGGSNNPTQCIYANGGTNIVINAVITSTAIGDFTLTIEQLF